MSIVIQVDRLSKHYRLGQIGGKRFVDDFSRWWAKVRGKDDPLAKIGQRQPLSQNSGGKPHDSRNSIYALRDVSFEVKKGEVLGIVGCNGAGKSTLLKILSRVTAPTLGEVRAKGRTASLLEVGTGFHPELTGRENIFLNGAILGMRKAEVRGKFGEIVEFAQVEAFVDTPVKRYSSGMQVRLAFAVAAHLDPEILIIDEVLAVGDAAFQQKCLGRIKDVAHQGRTILFVSHNMTAVRSLCTRVVLLEHGAVQFDGKTDEGLTHYIKGRIAGEGMTWTNSTAGGERLRFTEASVNWRGDSGIRIAVVLESRSAHRDAFLAIDLTDVVGTPIMQAIPKPQPFIVCAEPIHRLNIDIDLPPMIPGDYFVDLWVGTHYTETLHHVRGVLRFQQVRSPTPGRTFPHSRDHGYVVPHATVSRA